MEFIYTTKSSSPQTKRQRHSWPEALQISNSPVWLLSQKIRRPLVNHGDERERHTRNYLTIIIQRVENESSVSEVRSSSLIVDSRETFPGADETRSAVTLGIQRLQAWWEKESLDSFARKAFGWWYEFIIGYLLSLEVYLGCPGTDYFTRAS